MGIIYRDNLMIQLYAGFPEVLFVDATQQVNELRMPVYIFLVCDGMAKVKLL